MSKYDDNYYISQALMNSDIDYIDNYHKFGGIIYKNTIMNLGYFDPSYELINYIMNNDYNNNSMMDASYTKLIITGNMDKISYINSNYKYVIVLLKIIVNLYVDDDTELQEFYNTKQALSDLLDKRSNELTFDDINDISQNQKIGKNGYVFKDILSYIIFRITRDELFKDVKDIFVLINMLTTLKSVSGPEALIDTILKHLPEDAVNGVNLVLNNTKKLTKPDYYHSLFSEDI